MKGLGGLLFWVVLRGCWFDWMCQGLICVCVLGMDEGLDVLEMFV